MAYRQRRSFADKKLSRPEMKWRRFRWRRRQHVNHYWMVENSVWQFMCKDDGELIGIRPRYEDQHSWKDENERSIRTSCPVNRVWHKYLRSNKVVQVHHHHLPIWEQLTGKTKARRTRGTRERRRFRRWTWNPLTIFHISILRTKDTRCEKDWTQWNDSQQLVRSIESIWFSGCPYWRQEFVWLLWLQLESLCSFQVACCFEIVWQSKVIGRHVHSSSSSSGGKSTQHE